MFTFYLKSQSVSRHLIFGGLKAGKKNTIRVYFNVNLGCFSSIFVHKLTAEVSLSQTV